jgi:hypothetical protein
MSKVSPPPPLQYASEVQTRELAQYTRQLGSMLAAGVDALRALRIAARHSENSRLEQISERIAERLKDGADFHRALREFPDLFDPFYLEMARQGDTDGTLPEALLAIAEYLDHLLLIEPARVHTRRSGSLGAIGDAPTAMETLLIVLGGSVAGAGLIWGGSAARLVDPMWVGPLALLWSGLCCLAGVLYRRYAARPAPPEPARPFIAPSRPVSLEHTSHMVTAALAEQAADADEDTPVSPEDFEERDLEELELQPPTAPQNGKTPEPAAEDKTGKDGERRFRI